MLRVRLLHAGLLAVLLGVISGCEVLHNLQPHRLQRLNRTEPMGNDAYQFSIADPQPESATR